ncbi:MAG: MlaD family protein [Alphaproteobacteria bacterium]
MPFSQETRHILIGALAIAILGVFFVIGYSDDPTRHDGAGYRLSAIYRDATGIGPGSPVLLAGIPVGSVHALKLDTLTNEAIVEMTIDDGVEIPIDSEAMIVSSGMVGGKSIRILPGGDYEMLQPGETFDYARGSVDFVELFEKIVLMAESRSAENQSSD